MTIGVGSIGEYAIAEDSSVVTGGGGGGTGATAAEIWAYELLPGVSAGDMLLALYEMLSEVHPSYDAGRVLRIIAAAVAGKTTGGPGGFTARNLPDTTDQVVGTADASGNRLPTSYGS
jgi:hypothetical protein